MPKLTFAVRKDAKKIFHKIGFPNQQISSRISPVTSKTIAFF